MRQLAHLLLVGAGAVAGAASCDYPNFRFATDAGAPAPSPVQVPCTQTGAVCAASEVCCFDDTVAAKDHCGAKGMCGTNYSEFSCSGKHDCPGGVCCGRVNGTTKIVEGISCQPSCDLMDERVICNNLTTDCSPKVCTQLFTGYPGYGFCQ